MCESIFFAKILNERIGTTKVSFATFNISVQGCEADIFCVALNPATARSNKVTRLFFCR